MSTGAWTRESTVAALADAGTTWDLVVIGGGASGLGVALDAASRGLRVALLEAHDFARGTSSRSTKLVHGGVRYLANGQLGLVRSALVERARILQNAPHVAQTRHFILPADSGWRRAYYGIGLKLYDRLAGRYRLGPSRFLSRDALLAAVPTLRRDGIAGGVDYLDGQFDDARLAISIARSAVQHGAALLNYARVEALQHDGTGRLRGLRWRDMESGREHGLRAACVVNATGVYCDHIRRLDDPACASRITPSQGIHLVLERRFMPADAALIWPKTRDGRVLFAVPWHDRLLIGTTDTPIAQPELAAEPTALRAEVDYLLAHIADFLDPAPTAADIRSIFAGLRPLVSGGGGPTSRLSRDHVLETSRHGLLSLMGGKWTTYRLMAEACVDQALQIAGLQPRPCVTADLRLHGAGAEPAERAATADPLAVYGTDAAAIRALAAERPELAAPLDGRLRAIGAEVVWAARQEAARTVEDVLARRTRALLLDGEASVAAAPRVAALLAAELGRDAAWQAEQVAAYGRLARASQLSGTK